jgi:hypothetical protein
MPLFTLRFRVNGLEGVARVLAQPSRPDFALHLQLECSSCHEDFAKRTVLPTPFSGDKVDIPGGRGEATLVQKCASCASVSSIDVESAEAAAEAFTADLSAAGRTAALVSLECRGCVPKSAEAARGWAVEGSGGTLFEGVDLSSGDFCEFDELSNEAVTAGAIMFEVVPGKGKK